MEGILIVTPATKTNLISVAACLAICAFAGATIAAAPLSGAAAIQARQAGFKVQGGAFKTISDQLKTPAPDIAAIRTAANAITRTAGQINTWFPVGSGPGPGVVTKAKAEIWTDAPRFAAAMTAFRAQVPRLKAAADSGDLAAIRTEFVATGRTCGGCHIPFRAQ